LSLRESGHFFFFCSWYCISFSSIGKLHQ